MLKKIFTAIWGNFKSKAEIQKFLFLAFIFGLIIATYWTLKPTKDSIFNAIVGGHHLWLVKIFSIAIIAPLIMLYSKLIDMFARYKVFYILIFSYAIITLIFMFIFLNPTIGLINTQASPNRLLGWLWYVYVESFGSLMVALFWVLATDSTTPGSAKRGFPIIALFGQLGNIIGPYFINTNTFAFTTSAPVVGISSLMMVATGIVMFIFRCVTPRSLLRGYEPGKKTTDKKSAHFLEGLWIILKNYYVLGIFLIVSFYEIIVTIIDYHFTQTAFATFGSEAETSAFLSSYGYKVGIVAALCVICGINNIQRKVGMRASLTLLPLFVGVAVVIVLFNPLSLTVVLWIMILSKAINYSLNQPTLKQLFIPTSHEVKYKSQAWIDMFGSRGSKSLGFLISGARSYIGVTIFLTIAAIGSMGLITLWILIALYVSKQYKQAIEQNKVVC